MKARVKKQDSSVVKRQEQYEAAQKKKKIRNAVGYSLIGILTVLLLMAFAGSDFAGILKMVGIQEVYHAKTGVYADCSKRENRNISYCRPKTSSTQKNWKSLRNAKGGKHVPFTLHGK